MKGVQLLTIIVLVVLGNVKASLNPGQLNGIATGSMYIASNDLARAGGSKTYSVALPASVGSGTVAYALALAGFETFNSQTLYYLVVSDVKILNSNTLMTMNLLFGLPNSREFTKWLNLKWTYLVISASFDGTYSNIWATNAQIDPSAKSISNLPIDPIGNTFILFGGAPGDCDIFVQPLLQLDIPHCLKVAASSQYIGGKPIIHAYISGFSLSKTASTVSVSKGNTINPYSESDWEIVFSSEPPNGPKVTIPSESKGLTLIQISFVFVRMDAYASGYPWNSQLQYSSSHIFTVVNNYNTHVNLLQGNQNSYNQNYFLLPDTTYLLYGLSAFRLNQLSSSPFYSLMINLDRSGYWIASPSNSVQGVVLSGDVFIKNVMNLCNSKLNEQSLIVSGTPIKITPSNTALYSAIKVTQSVPITQLTTSPHPIVYKYAIASSPNLNSVTFLNTVQFSSTSSSQNFRLQIRFFQSVNMKSLVQNKTYNIKISNKGQTLFQIKYIYNSADSSMKSPTYYRGINKQTGKVEIDVTVSFQGSSSTQQLYLLLAGYYENSVYDTSSKQCIKECPIGSGMDASLLPMTCVSCDSVSGSIFDVSENTCKCGSGFYLNETSRSCMPCGPNCATCDPTNSAICFSCKPPAILSGGSCGCTSGQYLSSSGCKTCPNQCSTCVGPSGLCLTCKRPQPCNCASGYYDTRNRNCGVCGSYCATCSPTNPCLTCVSSQNRIVSKGVCICQDSYYQSSNGCLKCAPQCLTCNKQSNNCTSCDSTLNRQLIGTDCACISGYSTQGLKCVLTNCQADPLCAKCVTLPTKTMCVECVPGLNRVLNQETGQCLCASGFFPLNGKCFACGSGCILCSSLYVCSACATLALPQSDGTCICPPTTYLVTSVDTIPYCQNCGVLCLICTDNTSCKTCKQNAQTNEVGICQCKDGYFSNSTTGICQPCNSGCAICNEQNCTKCTSPLLLSGNQCLTSCKKGYSEQTGVCVPCVTGCSECLDSSSCAICESSLYLLNQKCVSECPAGTVISINVQNIPICGACSSSCLTCSVLPSNCTSCAGTYLYNSGENQECVSACPIGSIITENNCSPCHSSCFACSGSASNCIQCSPPLYLYQGGCVASCPRIATNDGTGPVCLDRCPIGKYTTDNITCSACALPCASCDYSSTNCTSCTTGVLVDYGVCVNQCAFNQYILGGVCYDCAAPCSQCFKKPTICISCPSGMLLSGTTCLYACPDKYYYNHTIMACATCRKGCASCSNSTYCLTCSNTAATPQNGECPFCPLPCRTCGLDGRCLFCGRNTVLFNGACLNKCPGTTVSVNGVCSCVGGVLQDGVCVGVCVSGSFANNGVCQACDPNCLQCQSNSTSCISCFIGFALNNRVCKPLSECQYGQSLVNGLCSEICPTGSYFLEGACLQGKCVDGYQNNGFGGCVRRRSYKCPNNMLYLEGSCTVACPYGYFANFYGRNCLKCPSNCDTCLNGMECFNCTDGYINLEGQCYLSCKTGVSVGGDCANSCPIGTLQIQNICKPRCPLGSYFLNGFCYFSCPSFNSSAYACSDQITNI